MKYIDSHTHAISSDTTTYPLQPVGGRQSNWSRDRPVTTEELLAAMDQAGVEQAALVQASTAYGYDNSYAAESLLGRETRFVGVCAVDFTSSKVVQDLDKWIDDYHFGGVRLKGVSVKDQYQIFRGPDAELAWSTLQDRQIPTCVGTDPAGLEHLEYLLRRFPRLKLLIDHGGNPDASDGPPFRNTDRLFALGEYGGVHFKVTTILVDKVAADGADPVQFMRVMVDRLGADRLLWGSNFPASAGRLQDLLERARRASAALTDEEQQTIFARTAESVYPQLLQAG